MGRKKASAPAPVEATVAVVEESLSNFAEDDNTPELDRREIAQHREMLSVGHGCYRTMPQYHHD